ncbi:hypothetical protein CHUAL_001568 [Chamberlinius hualienensis]
MSSSRVKRLLKKIENFRGKNKRRRISGCSDDDCGNGSPRVWTPKLFGDCLSSNIYNSTARSEPAELFRKDLISAMKLPDSEPLTPDDYWFISDHWKQEWEKGVQVPVNPDALPEAVVRTKKREKYSEFKAPKKLIRLTQNEFYSADQHHLSNVNTQSENICRYDLDDYDVNWLTCANRHIKELGLPLLIEETMEKLLEEFETQCYENMQDVIKAEAGLGIEFDEDVICDVCRSPDSEEGNEMVFCDSCDICVHQACYGITKIPSGSWICRGCDSGLKPTCVLCPNKGGAMKCTRSGQQWVHVSCALWIPEVSIGCVEKMEPITKLANIPPSRYTLVCCVCKEKMGACIQCSVKACKTAYHVTCAFRGGLKMKAVMENDEDEDGLKLRSYCPKHSKNKSSTSSDSDDDGSEQKLLNKSNDKNNRMQRLQEIEAGFFKYVDINKVAESLRVNKDVVDFVYNYWKLKRRTAFNKPLLIPKSGVTNELDQEDSVYAKMKMFVQIRQNLERVRNLCYMVGRRERLSQTWRKTRAEIFYQQIAVLSDPNSNLTDSERTWVIHACHGSSIYDRLCSDKPCTCQAKEDADGVSDSRLSVASDQEKIKRTSSNPSNVRLPNPYAKTYIMSRSSRTSRRIGESSLSKENPSNESAADCSIYCDGSLNCTELTQSPNSRVFNENGIGTKSHVKPTSRHSSKAETVADYMDYDSVQLCHQRAVRNRLRNHSAENAIGNEVKEIYQEPKDDDDNAEMKECISSEDGNRNDDSNLDNSVDKRDEESTENILSCKSKAKTNTKKSSATKCRLKELAKVNATEDVTQFRDKQKQESEKVHESLFATSQKQRLAGYRIPKKRSSNDLLNETKIVENSSKQELNAALTNLDILPQSSPPKDPRLTSPNYSLQNHSSTVFPFKVTSPNHQQLISAPRSQRSNHQLFPDNTYPPRLVMKLRKDRNYPESQQQWIRANDMPSGGLSVYDFPNEQAESPSIQNHELASSSYYEFAQSQQPNRYPLAAGRRNDAQMVTTKRTRNFNNNNNNYTTIRPTRSSIVPIHSIKSTYY